ncbi:MAG: endonuclease/exonuclease/phosphatase family protein [Verrucomicrobia bacterium]|nr:endonuclease/exonuclease/phosphatase family protein [Verrucomicrobiota bacterium]MCH8513276.1 endonuclease/exonuclease/phosphatase family protein [Kiritimatiellia bacterium]
MIHRKAQRIKRFMRAMWIKVFALALATLFLLAANFLFIRLTQDRRAIEITAPDPEIQPPARSPDSLRLLTYNIAHGRGPKRGAANTDGGDADEKRLRLEAIGRRIGELGLDLVALQEVDFNTWWSHGMDQAEIIAKEAGFPYIVRQRNFDTGLSFFRRHDFGNALLSRFPIVEAQKIEFPPMKDWENLLAGNHDGLLARVRIGEDRDILVVVAQLDSRGENVRVQTTENIIRIQRGSSLPMILMGNLNSTPPGFPDSRTTPIGQNTIEVLESLGDFQRRPARGQATWQDFTYPTEAPRRIIDWIMPDPNWTFMQYEVRRDFTESDHLPVMSTLRFRR